MVSDPAAPTERFSNRVDDYARWRPGYPAELVPWLVGHCGLVSGDAVADVGSGTGLFSRELLAAGLLVHGVEPNAAMRDAGARELAHDSRFSSHNGTAEATGLPSASVRLVTAAQAFHWFVPEPARTEFTRILQPGGQIALIWNVRREDTPFLAGYEALLQRHAPEYARSGVPAQADTVVIAYFFSGSQHERREFAYAQHFDREGLHGRLLSSSYAPARGVPGHEAMMEDLDVLFDAHQRNGEVAFLYRTQLFVGRTEK